MGQGGAVRCGAVPAAEERPDISAGWNWLHLLPSETGPVVSQDVVDPARQGLVTVAGDAAALVRVLQVHTAVRLRGRDSKSHHRD